jgi:hypothetical protein
MPYTVYIDSLIGSDSNSGDALNPVATITEAASKVFNGGIIVLQNGDGTSYGDITFTKNVTIKAAYGSSPYIGTINFNGYQGIVEGLNFYNITQGIVAVNPNIGSLIVRNCNFDEVDRPISLGSVNYVSIHRNFLKSYITGIDIQSAYEVNISSNVFTLGFKAVEVYSVGRIDLWKNTVYGASDIVYGTDPDSNLRVLYLTLNNVDITYKRIQLPGYAAQAVDGNYDVAFNIVNGPSFNYSTDFTVTSLGSIISWDGLQLESELALGDVVRVMYSEDQDSVTGEAIRLMSVGDQNSRIDSNSISGRILGGGSELPVGIGVYFNSPLKIYNNNFDLVDTWWDGPSNPTGGTGMHNFAETAMYRDVNDDDFHLQSSSPNINKADYGRWSGIYSEMGVERINGHFTGINYGTREQIAPFDRDIDNDFLHRGATGINGETGDVGAFEYNFNEYSTGNYVEEFGYDILFPGTETGPYATVDRGYARSNFNYLYVGTSPISGLSNGMRYGRYRSKNIILSDSEFVVGSQTKNDIVYIYPSHSELATGMIYVSPSGRDTYTGTQESPFRTINKALSENPQYVIVEPGYYPYFNGVSGINLVGVERLSDMPTNYITYSNPRDGSWTGIGTYSVNRDNLNLSSPVNVQSVFYFTGNDLDVKLRADIQADNLLVKILNNDNNVYVILDKNNSTTTIGFTTGGVSYELNGTASGGTLDQRFSNVSVTFSIINNYFTIRIKNSYINHSYSNYLTSGNLSDWRIQFIDSGSGSDTINNLLAMYESGVGVTGKSSSSTVHKMYAIRGSTGIYS